MDKQIEEMVKDIKASLGHHFSKTILYPYIAQDMYALGYRKIPKGAVVLTKEEYDEIKIYQSYIPEMKKAFDKVRKETAREILDESLKALKERQERVKAFYGVDESVGVDISIRAVKEIAKRYGVEVEE